jgi:diguanylate cyclase (GGDEF)-like protein/PAS domain S-box-containing protein
MEEFEGENLHPFYARVVESTDAAIAIADIRAKDQPLVYVNPAFTKMTGYLSTDVIGKNCRFLQGPNRDQSEVKTLRDSIANGRSTRTLLRNYRKDGSLFWNDLTIAPIFDATGEVSHYFSVCMDVSQQAARSHELQRLSENWRALLNASLSLTFVVSADGIVLFESDAVATVTGFPNGRALGRPWFEVIEVENANEGQAALGRIARGESEIERFEVMGRNAKGERAWLLCNARNAIENPLIGGIVIAAQDITAIKSAEAQLRYEATHDMLTDIGNRKSIKSWYEAEQRVERTTPVYAILWLLDLDQFKALNDSFGHAAGDEFLRKYAQTLQTAFSSQWRVARLGGDEFAIAGLSSSPAIDTAKVGEELLRLSQQPIFVSQSWITLSASIGVAVTSSPFIAFGELLRHADIAMYASKTEGRNSYHVYDAHAGKLDLDRLSLLRDLPNALTNNQFRVFYQPIVDGKTNKVLKYEMLLRWHHPVRGLLTADLFINELSLTGVCNDITMWVLNRGLADHREQLARGDYRLALNVWARSFRQANFADALAEAIAAHGLPPTCLEIEITEGEFVLTAGSVPETIKNIAAQGMNMVLDDFGKGFSNLSYLARFPVQSIKIDKSFIAEIGRSERNETLIRAMLALARDMGIEAVAEGVETEAQRRFMMDEGSPIHQGYFYGRPAALNT